MGEVEPRPEQMDRFAASEDDGGPIVMLNLNRYRDRSAYPADSRHEPCTGHEAYLRYGVGVLPLMAKHGARIVWAGSAQEGVICAPGESWDEVVLVGYPSRQAFIDMISSAEYAAVVEHRQAGIEDSRLIEMKAATSLPDIPSQ